MTDELIQQVKEMIIDSLRIEGMSALDIDTDAPLFGEGMGLDSIDALELVLGIEQVFGVKIEDEAAGLKAFKSVQALTDFIAEHTQA